MENRTVLARCEFNYIRVHENLVQHPRDNKSIPEYLYPTQIVADFLSGIGRT